jgi:hypothetical protein
VEQSTDPTTTMDPKHDISTAITGKSPDHNLRITNGINLGFNTHALKLSLGCCIGLLVS